METIAGAFHYAVRNYKTFSSETSTAKTPQMRGLVFLSILTILTHIYYKHSRNNQGLLFYFIECREVRKKPLLTLEKIKN